MDYYHIDAFTHHLFGGNPAGVVPLATWLPDAQMQRIAAENNLSETAFFAPEGDHYRIRWFTPTVEVDLCGHATLASAWVLFNALRCDSDSVQFDSASGRLTVHRDGDWLTLDFPARPPTPVARTASVDTVLKALGVTEPLYVGAARDLVVMLPDEAAVRALQPDFALLGTVRDWFAVTVTAPGAEADTDFVCRFFAPVQGLDEDPVTGSAFCTLIPLWAARLGRTALRARQVSARGGTLRCELLPDNRSPERVHISGQAVCYLHGRLNID
ncbi:hypothetical protein A167_01877 [Alcanivorax sp. S71-1-4]|uniref:PhzF family phenazine biosynthesis protein n=1 Tax=Alcanivorax sp. S71-1-4 TaxID=1177159 RepID=UPI00135CD48D|nr:PhzF family phenazine biosynthesis protein [Alcanivorax sp. S71-1-4]KAF0809285.1 hypothetical protein A167_01877 [Alcanivorax sp. S71-1-4]